MCLCRLQASGKGTGLSGIVVEQAIAQQYRVPHIQRAVTAQVCAGRIRQLLRHKAGEIVGDIAAVAYRILVDVTGQGSPGTNPAAIPDRIAVRYPVAIRVGSTIRVFAVLFLA